MKKIYTLLTSFVTAFCCVHQYIVLFVFLFTFGISNAWGQDVVEVRYAANDATGMRNEGVYLKPVVLGENASWSSNKIKVSSSKTTSFVVEINDTYSASYTIKSIVITYDGSGRPTNLTGNTINVESNTNWNAGLTAPTKVEFAMTTGGSEVKIKQLEVTLTPASTGGEGGGEGACTNPVITTQPENKSVSTGQTALLACAADKGVYQWYNATDNTAVGTGSAETQVTGGTGYNAGGWTTPVFSVVGVYSYYCVITDGECSVKTNTVTVTVSSASLPTYTVTYDANGGACAKTSENAVSVVLPEATLSGYVLSGWYTEKTGGTLVGKTGDTYTPSADITLYAQWTENNCPETNSGDVLYKFEVNSEVANGNISTAIKDERVSITTPVQLTTLVGGKLEGLASKKDKANNLQFVNGRIVFTNDDNGVLALTLNCPLQKGDIILFNNYSSSNGKYNYLRHTSYGTETNQLTLNAVKTTDVIQHVDVTDAFEGKTELFVVAGSRTTAISYFEIVRSCPITLNAVSNGGKVAGEDTYVVRSYKGENLALPHATKDGYVFKGWYTAPTGGELVSDAYTTVGAVELYAQFGDCPSDGPLYKFEVKTGLTNAALGAGDGEIGINTANYLSTLIGGTLIGGKERKLTIVGTNAISITDNAAYLKIDLDCAIKEGDYFKTTISSNTIYVTTEPTRSNTNQLATGELVISPIPNELLGVKTLYLWKGGGDANVSYFEIVRPKITDITLIATGAHNKYTTSVVATYEKEMPTIDILPKHVEYIFGGYYDQPDGLGTQYYDELGNAVRNWDKDPKKDTLYAKWITPCEAQPTIKVYNPNITIWDGKAVDLTLASATFNFDTTGIKYTYSITPAAISGCKYQFFDDQFHIIGVPTIGNTTEQKVTLTLTLTNDCPTPQTVQVEQNITILPKDQKARIALILTGTQGGEFNQYTAADATACKGLIDYLDDFYSITCVNGYATKDETEIANYYKNYDLLIVTDFLNTGLGYTNAIGTLIDKKPILSFEAYVAGENGSNWHIGSNPDDPKPKVQKMKILCAGHTIFGNDTYEGNPITVVQPDTTVQVLSSLSSEGDAKGLQGFTINNAPDFLFLATIRDADKNRDLIVCCERQVVFTGRLMIYGINSYEMDNLSPAGKIIMRQMVDYLLLTDETALADCALVFDNGGKEKPAGSGDHLWSNPKNWAPGRNIVPTPYHPTRIIAECHVDIEDAHAGSVKINRGVTATGDSLTGRIIVKPEGGLTVAGFVYRVNDIRYAVPLQTVEDDILIQANANNNGALVYGNKDSEVHATVQYYSKGEGSSTANPVWQYMGTPLQADKTAISMYYKAWMCRWNTATTDNLGGLWQWVENEDVIEPFEGYCITQEAAKTYTLAGRLNPPVTQRIILNNRDADGYAFAANSWTAPIKIQEMLDEDFTNAEKSIYIYYTGSYKEWQEGQPDIKENIVTMRGQYGVVPIHSAPYVAGADSVIPAMQGFFIKTTAPAAYVDLVYNRVVYDSKYFKTSTEPMRVAARDSKPEVLKMELKGPRSGDKLYMLMRSDFNEQFIDGWDGRKIEGDPNVPMLAVIKECGNMAVAAVEQANNHYLTFRAGKDSTYTFSFEYDSEQPLYLYDQLAQKSTEIKTGNTYTFTATNNTPLQRFLISDTPYEVPTSITLVETENSLHFENYGNQLVNVRIVDMQGRVVYTCNTTDEIVDIQPSLPLGVYLAHIKMGNDSKVVRLIGKETK